MSVEFTQNGYNSTTCIKPTNANEVYYPNYQISFKLSQTDFGQDPNADPKESLKGLIDGIESPNGGFSVTKGTNLVDPSAPTDGTLLTVPFDLSGLTGWGYLFVFNFCAYFKFSPSRIYNLSVTPITIDNSAGSTSDGTTYNQNLLGVGIPTKSSTTTGGPEYSGVTITFFIHNNNTPTKKEDILANDYLPAVILGEWMTSYLNKFNPGEQPGWEGGVAVPDGILFDSLINNSPSIANILKGIPWVPLNLSSEDSNNIINEITTPTMTNKGLPDIQSQTESFTSDIPNIIKRFRNRKLTEHLDGGITNTTVSGTIVYDEKCINYLTPLSIAPWAFDPASKPSADANDTTTTVFFLTPDDFALDADPTATLYNVWNNMKGYLNDLTGITLFTKPPKINPDLGDNTSGVIGFISALLDVYAQILQVSSTRFTVASVEPYTQDEKTKIINLTSSLFRKIRVQIEINNTIPDPSKPNDFLDSMIISTWLTNYWTSYNSIDTSLPLFIPPPINILNSQGGPVNPIIPFNMPGLFTNYQITYNPLNNGNTILLPHCLTTMVIPTEPFTGAININPNMIKLASRIKNIKLSIKNKGKVEKFGNFNRKLIENVSGGISTSRGSTSTSGSTNTASDNKQMFEPGSSTPYSILDYIFQFSYITCFVAAVILSVYRLTGWDIIQITLNDSFTNYIYIYIGICSVIALFSWFNTSIWYVDSNIVNSNNVAVSVTDSHLF